MARQKREKFTSPKGVMQYPSLTEPDYGTDDYPKPNGVFKVNLIVPADQVTDLMERVEELEEQARESAVAELEKKLASEKGPKAKKLREEIAQVETKHHPIEVEIDDNEDETGNVIIKAKMTYKITPKKGKPFLKRPGVFDAKGAPIKGIPIWSGSTGRISFDAGTYYTAAAGAGVNFGLLAAQVIELVGPGGGTASQHGFGEEEGFSGDDYVGEDKDDDDGEADGEADGGDDDDEADF